LGAVNVAGTTQTAPRRPITLEDLKTWNPDAIIVLSAQVAAKIRDDSAWRSIKAVAEHRVYAPPSLPFSWGPRPPSINRLTGMMWMAYILSDRLFDAAFFDDMRRFFTLFYHYIPSDEQMRRLVNAQ
jgi:iron complex transport system substrate-binding protein